MILNLVKNDYKRFISRPKTYKVYVFFCIVVLMGAFKVCNEALYTISLDASDRSLFLLPLSMVLIGNQQSHYTSLLVNNLFYSFTIIVSSFLIGDFIFEDYKTGFFELVLTKATRFQYYVAKILFILSAVFLIWMSLFMVDFFVKSFVFPLQSQFRMRNYIEYSPTQQMFRYAMQPYLSIMIDMILFSAFQAILSLWFIILSALPYKNYMVITLFPLFGYSLIYNILLGLEQYTFLSFNSIGPSQHLLGSRLLILGAFLLIELIIIWVQQRKRGDCL